jgi:acyl-CoA synthetase (AMP-forming)/AMP-acid ligase II
MKTFDESTFFLSDIWRYDDRIAVRDVDGQEVTFSELNERSRVFATEYLEPRVVAILVCTNSIDSIVTYIACLRSDVVPILLSDQLDNSLVASYVSKYQPVFILSQDKIDFADYELTTNLGQSFLYSRKKDDRYETHPELKILIPTSGSTGNPKLVRISNQNLISNCEMIMSSLPISRDDIVITTLPMSYSYGLSIINTHLLVGATIQLNDFSPVQRGFWNLILNSGITTFGGVPFFYQQLIKIGLDRLLPSKIRYLTQAGGGLPLPTLKEIYSFCERARIDFYVMYGQTEATARMSVLNPNDARHHFGSIGKAIPPGIFSLDSRRTESNDFSSEVGELVFSGKNVAMGYAESRQDLALPNEWSDILRTGDLAYFDNDGFPHIVGRVNRFVKVRGLRISLDDIETSLTQNGSQAAVTHIDEQIYLLATDDLIFNEIKIMLGKYAGLRERDIKVIRVAEIPRNHSGKIDYSAVRRVALRKLAEANSLLLDLE